jgi:hypothetical protein
MRQANRWSGLKCEFLKLESGSLYECRPIRAGIRVNPTWILTKVRLCMLSRALVSNTTSVQTGAGGDC